MFEKGDAHRIASPSVWTKDCEVLCANHLAKGAHGVVRYGSCLGLRFRYFRCCQMHVSGPTREQYRAVGLLEAFYLTSFFFFWATSNFWCHSGYHAWMESKWFSSLKIKIRWSTDHREVLQQVAKYYMYSLCSNMSLDLRSKLSNSDHISRKNILAFISSNKCTIKTFS